MRSTDRGTRNTVSTYIDSKYKIYFFGENRCNRCNRVTRAVKRMLYIEILGYISRKQKSNRNRVCVTSRGLIAYSGSEKFLYLFIFYFLYIPNGSKLD